MKAAVFHGPKEPLRIEEVTTPTPGPGEILVKVAACGVCHTDLHYIDHGIPTFKKPPLILGHEASGWVEAMGSSVQQWKIGDRVLLPAVYTCGTCRFCRTGRENICESMVMFGNNVDGAYAQYVLSPAKDAFSLPESLDIQCASILADAVSTPFHAVKNRGQVRPGDVVAVFGCGGVGINVVQLAAAAGAHVIAVDIDEGKLERALTLGASETFNPKNEERPDKALRALSGGGVDIAFEAIGNPTTIQQAYGAIRKGGRLVVIGYTNESFSFNPARLMYHELEVVGSLGCRPVDYPPLIRMAAARKIQVDPLVTGRYPLEDINSAFDTLRRGEGVRGIILPNDLP